MEKKLSCELCCRHVKLITVPLTTNVQVSHSYILTPAISRETTRRRSIDIWGKENGSGGGKTVTVAVKLVREIDGVSSPPPGRHSPHHCSSGSG